MPVSKRRSLQVKKAIEAEFFHQTTAPLVMTVVDDKDGYAAKTGFLNGFAVAQKE